MTLKAGTHIGPYEIVGPLGAGGMGEIYRARDLRLERTVAVKVLTSSRGVASAQLDRFQREARAIARLSHPHICTLHDVGDENGVPFLVMELLEGETLSERLERGSLPVKQATTVGVEIADALDAAHRKDVIHRDLKPSNVMLTPTGVKLLDFGLAKLRDAEYEDAVRGPTEVLTITDSIVGTLPYMAPEQIEGRDVDARTDIFSLGVVLYEMIAGRRPFEGDSRVSLMAAIVAAEPPSLSTLQPVTPPELERLIGRCLAKDMDHRWQTARDLAEELRWIQEGGSSTIAPPLRVARLPRRDLLLGSLALAILAGAALTGAAPWTLRRATVAEPLQVTYQRGAVSSARFTSDGQSFVYSASWDGQPYNVFHGRPDSPDPRRFDLESGRILSMSKTGYMAVLFGPQNIARAFGTRTLARVPIAGGTRKDLLDGVVDADWIPGTDSLAVIRDAGGNRPWTVEFPVGTIVHEARAAWSLRVSPDGNRIAFFEGPQLFGNAPEAMVRVIDRSGHKLTLSRNWAGIGLAWAPSGKEVWFTATHGGAADPAKLATTESRTGAPWLVAVSLSGAERTVYRAPDWLVLHDIAPDGRVLLARNTIRIGLACQPRGEASERDLSWQLASVVSDLSPDGRWVTFHDTLGGRTPNGNPTVFRRNVDGSAAVPLGEGVGATVSPDGRWALARRSDSLVLLPTGAGSTVTLPKGSLTQVLAGAWLDSRRIVLTGRLGDGGPRVYVQEIPGGTPRPITPEGVTMSPKAAIRNDNWILARSGDEWRLYSIAGGEPQPVRVLTAHDVPVQWSDNGRILYLVERFEGARSPGFNVFGLELATGRRVLWKKIAPSDPVGVEDQRERFVLTPDAQSYCYSYVRRLGDLFVVRGLQ